MKKLFSLILVMVLVVFGACSDDDTQSKDASTDAVAVEASVGSDASKEAAAKDSGSDSPATDVGAADQGGGE